MKEQFVLWLSVICALFLMGASPAASQEKQVKVEVMSRAEVENLIGKSHANSCVYWLQRNGPTNELVFIAESVNTPKSSFLKVRGKMIGLSKESGGSGCESKEGIQQKFIGDGLSVILNAKYWGGNKFGGDVFQGVLKVTSREVNQSLKVEGECLCN